MRPATPTAPSPFPLPLVGRRADLAALRLALDDAIEGRGRVAVVSGESGIGKSRLVEALVAEAATRQVRVVSGRGFALESARPYGVWADAIGPVLQALGDGAVATLARGVEWELGTIVPAFLGRGGASVAAPRDPDAKGRLFWNFAQFIARLARREPLLVVLEDLHFADPSSLELAHFVARQVAPERILLLATWVPDESGTPAMRTFERSLESVGGTVIRRLSPLSVQDTLETVQRAFAAPRPEVAEFCTSLHGHTGGHPFFIEEVLKSLIASGTLQPTAGGWSGLAGAIDASLPSTVRETVLRRLEALPPDARRVAEVVALAGTQATLDLLEAVSALAPDPLAGALDAPCARQVLREPARSGAPYDFVHHMVRKAVEASISEARARAIHRSLATALQRLGGSSVAGEVARHLVRAGITASPEAVPHLVLAARDAMARRADREAASWLRDAVSLIDRAGDPAVPPAERRAILEDAALAHQRVGDAGLARTYLEGALDIAFEMGDDLAQAHNLRRLANGAALGGNMTDAFSRFAAAEAAARRCGREDLVMRTRVATAMTLQAVGRVDEAKAMVEALVPGAEASGDAALIARVHRALVQLYGWTGPAQRFREHADRALEAAKVCGDEALAWSVHWALAMVVGLSGNSAGVVAHRGDAERLARALRSPSLEAATAEIAIEYASAVGHWTEGLALAEQAIPLARAIAPRTLLPRILVWAGIMLLARDEMQKASALLDEAWELSGAADNTVWPPGAVHNLIIAHTGRAAQHLAAGDWREALRLGEAGLALADRHGHVVWAIHRLLPIIAEALLWLQDYARAEEVATRLRRDSELLDHKLGRAWATAIEALIARLRDGSTDATQRLLSAAEELEAVPFVFHAARLRRNAAQLLEADGRVDDAVRELRVAHDVFLRLGAELELRGTRSHLRSLGVRLPPRQVAEGAGALTGRELEIARFVARRLSNKEIASNLDISVRTVSTHLSNIFQKLGVDSRGALADLVRDNPVLGGEM